MGQLRQLKRLNIVPAIWNKDITHTELTVPSVHMCVLCLMSNMKPMTSVIFHTAAGSLIILPLPSLFNAMICFSRLKRENSM